MNRLPEGYDPNHQGLRLIRAERLQETGDCFRVNCDPSIIPGWMKQNGRHMFHPNVHPVSDGNTMTADLRATVDNLLLIYQSKYHDRVMGEVFDHYESLEL